MAILIRSMEMPKTCEFCPLNHDADCSIAPNHVIDDIDSFIVASDARRADCPLENAAHLLDLEAGEKAAIDALLKFCTGTPIAPLHLPHEEESDA